MLMCVFFYPSAAAVDVMVRMYLFVGEALLSENLQQGGSIAVSSLEHLPDDGQKVPDAFWLSAPQRSQETRPFSSGRRLRGRQVHRVYITMDHKHTPRILVK